MTSLARKKSPSKSRRLSPPSPQRAWPRARRGRPRAEAAVAPAAPRPGGSRNPGTPGRRPPAFAAVPRARTLDTHALCTGCGRPLLCSAACRHGRGIHSPGLECPARAGVVSLERGRRAATNTAQRRGCSFFLALASGAPAADSDAAVDAAAAGAVFKAPVLDEAAAAADAAAVFGRGIRPRRRSGGELHRRRHLLVGFFPFRFFFLFCFARVCS